MTEIQYTTYTAGLSRLWDRLDAIGRHPYDAGLYRLKEFNSKLFNGEQFLLHAIEALN